MIRSILETMLTMLPYVAIGLIALAAGYNQGYMKGYIHAIEDFTQLSKHDGNVVKLSKVVTPRKAAGVEGEVTVPVYVGDEKIDEIIITGDEVAPVQQERNIWENPTHQGKK